MDDPKWRNVLLKNRSHLRRGQGLIFKNVRNCNSCIKAPVFTDLRYKELIKALQVESNAAKGVKTILFIWDEEISDDIIPQEKVNSPVMRNMDIFNQSERFIHELPRQRRRDSLLRTLMMACIQLKMSYIGKNNAWGKGPARVPRRYRVVPAEIGNGRSWGNSSTNSLAIYTQLNADLQRRPKCRIEDHDKKSHDKWPASSKQNEHGTQNSNLWKAPSLEDSEARSIQPEAAKDCK